MTTPVRGVLRGTVAVDRAGLQGRDGLGTALGVGVPLLVGVALDRPIDGLAAAGGSFAAGYALFAHGYRTRLSVVLLATLGVAGSTFVGAAVGDVLWLFALTAAVWGLAAGMLVSLGVAAGIMSTATGCRSPRSWCSSPTSARRSPAASAASSGPSSGRSWPVR